MTAKDDKLDYTTYDVVASSKSVFHDLLQSSSLSLPSPIISEAINVEIYGNHAFPTIPTPWRETEAITTIKAIEACICLAIARLRFPDLPEENLKARISTDHATLSLFMSYLSTVNGYEKWDKRSLSLLKPTDIHRAQSNLYRRLSANIYETKDEGVYYHTHGSLDATPILNALDLPGFLEPDSDDYDHLCHIVQNKTKTFTAKELDDITARTRQAGAMVLKEQDFLQTDQGRLLKNEPVIKVERIPDDSPPTKWPQSMDNLNIEAREAKPSLLRGIKVLDLTRVIAGPSITRTLAEYGASVLKVTSPNLPDVPWYQVDLNFGKRTCELDLQNARDRTTFERLLDEDGGIDVIVDGYRPGSLERLGYGVSSLTARWKSRGKGFVYVRESCFGHVGPWRERSGWQPIADAVSGLAWGHGIALGLDQPVLPPFPMSDYGTGALGATGALLALFQRAIDGGSYVVDVSLTGWNLFVQSLGMYPEPIWRRLVEHHRPEMGEYKIGHLSNFDIVSKAGIKTMKRTTPRLFDEQFMFEMTCPGFKGKVRSMKPVVEYQGLRTGFGKGDETRPNGYDKAEWPCR